MCACCLEIGENGFGPPHISVQLCRLAPMQTKTAMQFCVPRFRQPCRVPQLTTMTDFPSLWAVTMRLIFLLLLAAMVLTNPSCGKKSSRRPSQYFCNVGEVEEDTMAGKM